MASTGSRFLAYEKEGVTHHMWISAGDGEERESHKIDGEVRAVNEPFSNGLLYPLQEGAPAREVVNCRCDTAPVKPK
jgi:hypothetical protein